MTSDTRSFTLGAMRAAARTSLLAALVVVAGAALRAPLHRATFALPLSNDDAVPLLMARHLLRGELVSTLWNQPYNGALDAYLLAPGLLLAQPHTLFRAYELTCAVLLVVAVGLLAARLRGPAAGWTGALLAAWATPYMALMAATGPVPNFLMPLLVAAPLVAALAAPAASASRRRPWLSAGWGLLCGLALWNSALALPAFAGVGAGLLLAGLRPRRAALAAFALGLALGLAPLALARALGASAPSAVTDLRPPRLWADGLSDLARAAAGLLGLTVPQVVDGPERDALPAGLAPLLGLALALLVALGVRVRRAWPLLGWASALAAAFALSRRTGPDEIRYLYGLVVPVLALAGAGAAVLAARSRAVAALAVAALLGPWLVGQRLLVARWRDPQHAARVWQVPPLAPVVETLERAGVASAYASLQFAARLTLESGERVVASQAWNERIPGDPLRFRDEVDLDPHAAWVLHGHLSRGMPRAAGFRALLETIGGRCREDLPGEFVVFRRCVPPYDERRPVPGRALRVLTADGVSLPEAVVDRDGRTGWSAGSGLAPGGGLEVVLTPPRRVSALVVLLPLEATPLGLPWVLEADGTLVASGPARFALQWLNGVPRAGRQAALAVSLGDREAGRVRLLFQAAGPLLEPREVFVYGPDEELQAEAGAPAAASALARARDGDWDAAVALYAEAVRLEPERASYHANLARARWRAAHRRRLDVESLDDGGAAVLGLH